MIVPTSPTVDATGRYAAAAAPQAAPRAVKPPRPKPRSGETSLKNLNFPLENFF